MVIHTKHFPFGRYIAINLFGIIFTKKDNLSRYTINHENIHTAQMKELLYIGFYLLYGLEYIIKLLLYRKGNHETYRSLSFEREAYAEEYYLNYLKYRKHYSWIKYIKNENKRNGSRNCGRVQSTRS